ncbi:transcription termination/antitermination protein NusA [bacterium]|jgi:N utilization substance protein A|nr:transcription termination/antitermination protein NusA [bacterium]
MASEISNAIKHICDEKNLPMDAVISAIEAALAAAYRKDFGEKNQNVKVVFNADNAQTAVFDVKTVVEDVDLEEQEKQVEELRERKEAEEEIAEEDEIKRFNPRTEIMLSEAKEINPNYKIGDVIETKLEVPDEYGRMAAQTAKQVIIQRLREAERDHVFNEYQDKEGTLVLGTISRREGRRYLVDLGQATAVLPPEEQIPREGYNAGTRLNFYVVKVHMTNKGPEIILSRTHPDIVRELFAMEVPEIAAGNVEIKAISREAGSRSKVAVATDDESIDPIGSCVGQKGARIQTIINELGGEKIDIIEWEEDVKSFIANALSPAKVNEIQVNEDNTVAKVLVDDDQLSLAIGKSGQNVRLAAKLVNWKIDIVSSTAEATDDKDESTEEKKEKKEKAPADEEEKPTEEDQEKKEEKKAKKTTKKKTTAKETKEEEGEEEEKEEKKAVKKKAKKKVEEKKEAKVEEEKEEEKEEGEEKK